LIKCLLTELYQRKNYLENEEIETVYFGGGTPSSLDISDISMIFEAIYKNFKIIDNPEISFEANPEDLTLDYLSNLKNYTPVNRLSIGIQSFNDRDLLLLNRRHNSQTAENSLINSFKTGFSNVSADIIFAIPGSGIEVLEKNIYKLLDYPVNHISTYGLTVEKSTALANFINKGKVQNTDEEDFISQYIFINSTLGKSDFIHYELSNYARNNYFSIHNSNYWKQKNYLGIGPSAHSFNGYSRQWNIKSNIKYIKAINESSECFEIEILSEKDKFNEYLMTSLRTVWGVDNNFIKENYRPFYNHFIQQVDDLCSKDFLKRKNNFTSLTENGKFIADNIISNLFID